MKNNRNIKRFARMLFTFCTAISLPILSTAQEIQISKAEAKAMYSTKTSRHITIHDPSITYDPVSKQYYIYGTHHGTGKSSDLQNWYSFNSPWGTINSSGTITSNVSNANAFVTNQTKTVTIGGEEVQFGNFSAAEWAGAYGGWDVNGNMWAPDIIYNPHMEKWCQYLSINGPTYNSVIILLTSDNIEGPYVYQGPVVYSGFLNATDSRISYKKTDMELVLGKLSSLPARYNQGNSWGHQWLNSIDPCVFFDEEGKLWMVYGSWFGGLYMLELNEENGLRDYDVKYSSDYDTKGRACTSDAYFGKKVAGGFWVSGEGPYIEHIGDYYYLFVTNGGLEANGGYEMRLFRSKNPNGPFTDSKGINAIYTSGATNFGVNCDTRGNKLIGPYDKWGFMTRGERAQGHNSVIAAEDGRTYLVYHTRFNKGTEEHQVRVHQLFLNENDWLVAAPFEYTGETVTDEDIRTKQMFTTDEVVGNYKLLIHKYSMDHKNGEEVLPVSINLNADGTISGAQKGKWSIKEGTSFVQITLGTTTYDGVLVEQHMEPTTIKAICFTASNKSGVNIWGYKMRDEYNLAYQLNNSTINVRNSQSVSGNLYLYNIELNPGISMEWTSSNPEILSSKGIYNPTGLTEKEPVELTVKISCGKYYWADTISVNVMPDTNEDKSHLEGIVSYYDFDSITSINRYNNEEKATRRRRGSGQSTALEEDSLRNGGFFHQPQGSSGNESYTLVPNPFYEKKIDSGITISFWMKSNEKNLWDGICSFYNQAKRIRFYMTGNAHFGFRNGNENWLDINHPDTYVTNYIPVGEWCLVTITLSREGGVTLYVNSGRKSNISYRYKGLQNGTDITKRGQFDFNEIIDFIEQCPNFYFGYGSLWGSADICFDDLLIYDREMTATDVLNLWKRHNRVTDFTEGILNSINEIFTENKPTNSKIKGIYDFTGRRVNTPIKGNMYIIDGKKVVY